MSAITTPITVYVIDDDEGVRRALGRVFRSVGIDCIEFASAETFLASDIRPEHACVVSDMHVGCEAPAELPRRLAERQLDLPVMFISADDSDDNLARVNRAGGAGFFHKPVDDQALIDAVRWAIRDNRQRPPG